MENNHTDVNPAKASAAPKSTSQPVSPSPAEPLSSQISAKTPSPWGIIVTLLLLLTVTFMGAMGGYHLYQEIQTQQALSNALKQQLASELIEPNQRIKQLEQQQRQFKSTVDKALKQAKTEQTQLQERVSIIAQRNPNHWRAEEAQYLVRLAGQKLWLEKDPTTATSLLKAADERIKSMRDPSLLPLRKALAKDISATSAIKTTDITGTVLTLDTVIEQLDTLPLNRASVDRDTTKAQDKEMTGSLDDWRSNLAKSWQALIDDFVVIRKRTTDVAPLLEPDQQWYLVENTRNKLLQAQLALYRQDQVNYRNAIALARTWIYQYFDLNDQQVKDVLSTLNAFETLKIQTVSIKHFGSSALLNQLVTNGNLMPEEPKT